MSEQTKVTTDEELVEAAQMGSAAALERLVERYHRIVYAIAYARLRQHEAAEDLVQEIFLSVYLKLGNLKNPRMFGPWVSRIARNAAINWLDKGWRQSKLVAMVPLDEKAERLLAERAEGEMQKTDGRERDEAVRAAIFRLPLEQREIVLMRYIEGISVEEIAQRTGVHVRTVWRQLNRAIAQMKASVESLLADAAPAIRAPKSTVVRTLAVLGAASVLSASAKSAMAASAPAVLAEQCLASLTAAVPGAASLSAKTLGVLKTIAATGVAGGQIVGTGKIIAVGVVGVGLLVGGRHYLENKQHAWRSGSGDRLEGGTTTAAPAASSAVREPGRVYIEKSRGDESSMQVSSSQTMIRGSDAKSLIIQLYSFPTDRCQIRAALPEGKYDVSLDLLQGQANSRNRILRKGFEKYFGLTSRKEMQEMDVLLLTAPNGPGPAMRPPAKAPNTGMSIESSRAKGLSGTNVNMLNMAGNLEAVAHKPVIDESGLRGTYDFTLRFDQSNPQSVIQAARNQLGLVLTPARRPVEVLIIENRKR